MIQTAPAAAIARALAAAALAFAAGCYSNRFTSNYDDEYAEDISNAAAVIGESGQDEESENARLARLRELASAEEPEYRLNAGDHIAIKVYGHDDLSMETRVSPDGRIGMVFVGQLKISGKTIGEASAEIERGIAPYVKHPVVGITVLEVASETVTVAGACSRPGLYHIASDTRLADAYALAGGSGQRLFNGVDVDIADLQRSIVVRDGEILPVDFKLAIEKGDILNNINLHRGDYIYIAQRMESSITICGDVNTPHRRLYEEGAGLIGTLAAAGWMQETHWSHVIIIRDSLANPKMYKVDVDGILAGKCPNIKLQPNDIVYVPKDNLAEYNVFVRKLLPSAQLFNLLFSQKLTTENAFKKH